ncbi:ATP-binding protein [Paraburkholderia sp. CNPSo 3272]|uniref:hybrid sensor histidine kinase/response regulator n=1 Tax=Paraburkholderia sp. CNPSo 3272 TaxID=2940931 RepID=UPI0020B8D4D1|nr:ATP-binding protein [Paraburkholderia sp. CNPSo 3272]MCP3726333.1 ATP-binding protein [Paraburkholderia sp. CNPSo 3272]
MAPKSRSPAIADIDARPSRAPDHARENQALLALVTAQLDSREVLLQRIADFAMRLCGAQSAGISLLEHEGEERYFRWHSVAGEFANLCGTRIHWRDCPCAVVFEAGKPLLFTALSDDFPVLAPACAVVQEALILPIVSKGRQLGAIWAASLEECSRFTREDQRVLSAFAAVAGSALDLVEARDHSRMQTQRYSEVIAVLAHEFRNPLAPLENAFQALQMICEDRPLQREYFAVAQRQIAQLKRLMDELQDASRLDHDKLCVDPTDASLNEILSDALASIRERAQARRHTLSVHRPGGDLRLFADPTRLTQVIVNLLSNAVRYTPDGGEIAIVVEQKGAGDARCVEISIRDNGIGIDPSVLSRIFEPFAQFAGKSARLEGGLGIGLPIAQRLAQLHGGEILVTSEGIGRGTLARLSIPVRTASAEAVKPLAAVLAGNGPARVLIVDDNADARFALGALLELEGHDVRTAGDGTSALSVLRQWKPHLALVDIGMPGMNGYELAERLRAMPDHANVMLVALSGHVSDSDRAAALAAGFHAHLAKPADIGRLRAMLATCAQDDRRVAG